MTRTRSQGTGLSTSPDAGHAGGAPSGRTGTDALSATFFALTPDRVIDAVEIDGRRCTGRFIVLNSYENRVYQLETEDAASPGPAAPRLPGDGRYVVAKFYRPGRWSDDAILDEHDFLLDLEEAEVPVAAPLELPCGGTIGTTGGIRFSLVPRFGGRAPDEMDDEQLREVGRLVARIHQVGRTSVAEHRMVMHPARWLLGNLSALLEGGHLPAEVRDRYASTVRALHALSAPLWDGLDQHRIHGDCHLGNLLRTAQGMVFLDFDDMVTGPPVQDLWLLQGSRDAWGERRMELMLEGYETIARFDRRTLRLVEPLRAMRMVHFAAWIARRWQDPAFPAAFPAFGTTGWWSEQTRDIQAQHEAVLEALGG